MARAAWRLQPIGSKRVRHDWGDWHVHLIIKRSMVNTWGFWSVLEASLSSGSGSGLLWFPKLHPWSPPAVPLGWVNPFTMHPWGCRETLSDTPEPSSHLSVTTYKTSKLRSIGYLKHRFPLWDSPLSTAAFSKACWTGRKTFPPAQPLFPVLGILPGQSCRSSFMSLSIMVHDWLCTSVPTCYSFLPRSQNTFGRALSSLSWEALSSL